MARTLATSLLVHSYRDDDGKPRHSTLAYLGKSGELKPGHIEAILFYANKVKASK